MAEHKKKGASPLASAAAKMGKSGGPARARALTSTRRKEIASLGGQAKAKGTHKHRTKK